MKTAIIIALLLVIVIILVFPRASYADAKCSPTLVPITSRCPPDFPITGVTDDNGNKTCCKP